MALNNFFKINFPYGIMKNNDNEWACFNREYKPLGTKDSLEVKEEKDFVFCKYKGLTDKVIEKLSDTPGSLKLEDGEIKKIYFYNDATNPSNQTSKKLYSSYFNKLEIVSKLKVQ